MRAPNRSATADLVRPCEMSLRKSRCGRNARRCAPMSDRRRGCAPEPVPRERRRPRPWGADRARNARSHRRRRASGGSGAEGPVHHHVTLMQVEPGVRQPACGVAPAAPMVMIGVHTPPAPPASRRRAAPPAGRRPPRSRHPVRSAAIRCRRARARPAPGHPAAVDQRDGGSAPASRRRWAAGHGDLGPRHAAADHGDAHRARTRPPPPPNVRRNTQRLGRNAVLGKPRQRGHVDVIPMSSEAMS
jgi:hypothetical protein